MSCFYHVTSQKATGVSHSFTCNFTGPNDLNLIVGKFFYFEIYLVTPEGLRLMRELPINGRISAAINFKRNGRNLDSIIVVTEKADAAIIDCIREDERLDFITYASGNIGDNSSILSDLRHEIIIDPTNQIILFKFFDGVFKAILMKDLRILDPKDCETSQALNVVPFRVEDGNILGIFSLHGSEDYATIGLFVEDNKMLNMKSFKMSFNQVDVTPDEWKIDALPPDTQFIIPVEPPYCGILIVGNKSIIYHNRLATQIPADIPIHKASTVVCYEKIDVHKYLLGDMMGRIYMVVLFHEGPGTSSTTVIPNCLKVSYLGEVCIPENITYLDNGVVFVGSTLGDSQLIRLSCDTSSVDSEAVVSIQVLERYMNVGPIIDIELQEVNGQNQLLMCSGAYREGCVKIVRNGIGIQELLIIDQANIKNVWSLKFRSGCDIDNLLGFSWPGRSEIFTLEGDDLRQWTSLEFDRLSSTIFLSVVGNEDHMLQVTDRELRLISMITGEREALTVWFPPSMLGISRAATNGKQVVVGSGCDLFYLEVVDHGLNFVSSCKLSHEIACLDMSPFHWNSVGHDDPTISEIVAVSFWIKKSVCLVDLKTMATVASADLTTTGILPRSVLIVQFNRNAAPYLMVGMDNGNLIYFQLDMVALVHNNASGVLTEQRRVTIGTGPFMNLSLWNSLGQSQEACVFVCSNHPSIIHYSDGRLLFSSINLKNEVLSMCPLNSAVYKNCLVLVSESNIIFGSIDKIQKLHVRSVPLHESPRRMTIQKETDSIGLITMRFDTYHENSFRPMHASVSTNPRLTKSVSSAPELTKRTLVRKMRDIESAHLIIMNQTFMEPVHCHSFYCSEDVVEQATSITTMKLPISIINHEIVPDSRNMTNFSTTDELQDDPMCGGPSRTGEVKLTPVYIVGTAYVIDEEQEPTQGCLYVFHYNERTGEFTIVKTFKTTGIAYDMQEFDGKLLSTFNCSVQLLDLTKDDLHIICRYDDNIIALFLKRKDDFILIGDLMRSVTLLRYKPNVAHFEVIAQHRAPHWTTAIEIIDDDKFLVAENEMNIFIVSRDFDLSSSAGENVRNDLSTMKEERFRMTEYASIHVGQVINKFMAGNILMQPLLDEYRIKLKNSILYGSTTGTIGQVFEINQTLYTFLKSVESQMQSILVPIGNFPHETWRSYVKIRQCKVAERFIDGDLVENFQNLDMKDKLKIVNDIQIPVDFSSEVAGFKECSVDDLTRIIEELSRFH